MTPTPEQPQQKLEDYLKSCNDREYAEYIIATMTHGNSPSDFDKIQKEAIQAIRSRPITPDYTNDKCGSDKCLAIINRKVEERTATIRNATLDKIHARYVDAYLNPDNYNEINAKEVYQFIESLRSKGGVSE